MIEFMVNNKLIRTSKDVSLMSFLRDELKITSVKDGCSTGACGACSVLIDGVSKSSCKIRVLKLSNKSVITVEGLSDNEKEIYSYAFAKAGAVQCGFCIPGMVISAKGLLDKNPNPTEDDIKKAIRKNICRCTGYVKIISAINMAAKYLREGLNEKEEEVLEYLDSSIFRPDAREKVLGYGEYVDDIYMDDMLYGQALRSKYPRAIVNKINIENALKHKDIVKIVLAKDVPGSNKHGHIIKDWDVIIAEGSCTRYVGDAVALVVSKKKETLNEILDLIEVDYTELVPFTSPKESLREGADLIHENGNILSKEHLIRGENIDNIINNADYVVTNTYNTPFTEHAFMEPECALGSYSNDILTLYTASQSIYDEQREISHILGLDTDRIHIKSKLVGGGFGGKEDMSVQHHAALLAYLCEGNVKVKLSRQESIIVHPKRHAMEIVMTTACDKTGKLLGMKAVIVSDTGAYASLGGPVIQRACTHAAGPYNYQNIDIEGTAVYTNNPPAGAFRGFGVTQSTFACECNLNQLANKIGISQFDIRYINAIKPKEELPNGQIADESTALVECLDTIKEEFEESNNAGLACSFKNSGIGVGLKDVGRCIMSVEEGKIHVRTSAARIGQGLDSVILQIACQTLNLPPKNFILEAPDTKRTPSSGTTTASRQTLFTGEAVRRAGLKVKEALSECKNISELNKKEYFAEYSGVTDKMGSKKKNPISHIAYGYAAQMVELNDNRKVKRVLSVYDVGKVINRINVEGQIEGGVVMALGYALTEDYPLENCIPKAKYGTLGLFRASDIPKIETIIVDKEFKGELAYGAKGVGELAAIPTAPAVQGAYYNLDKEFRTSLPLKNTPYSKGK